MESISSLTRLLFQDFGKGSSISRCDLKQNLLKEGCSQAAVEFPSSTLTIEKDAPLSDKASGAADDVTQVKPQKIHMTLRKGTLPPGRANSKYHICVFTQQINRRKYKYIPFSLGIYWSKGIYCALYHF